MKKKALKKEIEQLREQLRLLQDKVILLEMQTPKIVSIPSVWTPTCQHEWDGPGYQVGDFPPGSIKCKKCGEAAPTITISNTYMNRPQNGLLKDSSNTAELHSENWSFTRVSGAV